MTNDIAQTALVAQLQIPGNQSKKYRMTVMGMIGVLFIFLFVGISLFSKPSLAAQLTSLAQIAIPAITGLVVVYTGAQTFVDQRTTASLASQSTTS